MRHIISLLLENESGALSRVSGLFSARGYNIESLTVAPTQDETLSRMTIVTRGPDRVIAQIVSQLEKLIDVVRLIDLTEGSHIERELMMVKLRVEGADYEKLQQIVDSYSARILDVEESTYTIEKHGTGERLDELLRALGTLRILEVVRSGVTGISLGTRSLQDS